jgi:hypothetical protein
MIPSYSLVLGVDKKHLDQLNMVWKTWRKNKPSITRTPLVVFYDKDQVNPDSIKKIVNKRNLTMCPWPLNGATYSGDNSDKFNDPQRHKMLAGFVHVPPALVQTEYWLKMDLDSVAMEDDDWINEDWFKKEPAIISHGWSFTKPANQMDVLDEWVLKNKSHLEKLNQYAPLNLHPKPDATRIGHKRIISWCSFWKTSFSKWASWMASTTCGMGGIPVPSQDGYLWYCAKRAGLGIVRTNMKDLGWEHQSSHRSIEQAVMRAMKETY